jgi:ArsR family transcriptional regulator, arsenate/arsenite/antimonite-responsive transcriptional repressor
MPAKVEPALARRLEMLTGEDGACCARDWKAFAAEVRAAPRFDAALARAKAMSDEARLLALAAIKKQGSMCGCEIQAALGVTHATVSHHMRVLSDAGLVEGERRGKWIYYRLTPEARNVVP